MILVDIPVGHHWSEWATCIDQPSEDSTSGVGMLETLQQFISMNCERCPVKQQCLDDSYFWDESSQSYVDDGYFTVRGGYLPTAQGPKGRGRPKTVVQSKGWKPKPPPVNVREGSTPLERGICSRGLHGIETEGDLCTSGQCRACRNERERLRGKGVPLPERATCAKGLHPWTEENIRIKFRSEPGKGGTRTCRLCEAVTRKKRHERERGGISPRPKVRNRVS